MKKYEAIVIARFAGLKKDLIVKNLDEFNLNKEFQVFFNFISNLTEDESSYDKKVPKRPYESFKKDLEELKNRPYSFWRDYLGEALKEDLNDYKID